MKVQLEFADNAPIHRIKRLLAIIEPMLRKVPGFLRFTLPDGAA